MSDRQTERQDHVASERDMVVSLLKKEQCERYAEIVPVLALVQFYAKEFKTDVHRTMFCVNWGDWEETIAPVDCSKLKALIRKMVCVLLYIIILTRSYIRRVNCNKGGIVLFSNTAESYGRFSEMIQKTDEQIGCGKIITIGDVLRPWGGDIKKACKAVLKGDMDKYFNLHTIKFLPFWTLSGNRLKNALRKWGEYISIDHSDLDTDNPEIDSLLDCILIEYKKRKKKIGDKLNWSDIRIYITMSQENLRDVLIADICCSKKIRTAQLDHGALQFTRRNLDENRPLPYISYVQEYFVWNRYEKIFREKVFSYETMFAVQGKIRINIAGNPEISYERACQINDVIPAENRITFMTSDMSFEGTVSQEQFLMMKKWRMSIFMELKRLKEEQNIEIRIRYKPFQEMEFRAEEIPILQTWGFEISKSTPESLMEDICASIAVMSTTSSVLSTACAMGRTIFRIKDPEIRYLHLDPNIIDLDINEIHNIRISELCKSPVLNPEDFFDACKLLG